MEVCQTLGVVDVQGQPREPVHKLGPAIEKGDKFYICDTKRLNHADFNDAKVYFDVCQFFEATFFLYPGLISEYFL